MIQEFSFLWNGRKWNGYFNALAHKTIIAHFEDDLIRSAVGQSLSYFKLENGSVQSASTKPVSAPETGIYAAILKGVEVRLGKPVHVYLN